MKTLLLTSLLLGLLMACGATRSESFTGPTGASQIDPVVIRLAAGGVT